MSDDHEPQRPSPEGLHAQKMRAQNQEMRGPVTKTVRDLFWPEVKAFLEQRMGDADIVQSFQEEWMGLAEALGTSIPETNDEDLAHRARCLVANLAAAEKSINRVEVDSIQLRTALKLIEGGHYDFKVIDADNPTESEWNRMVAWDQETARKALDPNA